MYLGIDLGTSEVKVLLLDASQHIIACVGSALTVNRPQARWAEQDPAAWWTATLDAINRLRAAYPHEFSLICAIGLSGQMHGAVLLDKNDQVLRPAILWNDMRSVAECAELTERVPHFQQITGNLAMPGFTAPKLLWLQRHEPELAAQVHCVLLPKDWLRLQLSGDKVSDPSDAAGTLWLDVARRDWSDELLKASGLTRAHMPKLVEGNAISGMLKPELMQLWGLSGRVMIAGGAGDNAASAIGMGATQTGDGFISLGTSGVMFVVNNQFRPNPASAVHTFCHALPQRWHQMSVILSAASCLHWLCKLTNSSETHLLTEVAALSNEQLDQSPIFLPYFSGERTPHNDPFAQGLFYGLNHSTDRAKLGYAVIEGVAFALKDGLDALRAAGSEIETLSLMGGGARSPYWAQLIADILGVRIVTHHGGVAGAALGAARLACLCLGGNEAEVCQKPPIQAQYWPHDIRSAALTRRLGQFRALYHPHQE